MIEHAGKVRSCQRTIAWFGSLLFGCWGALVGQPSWGQDPMPPTPETKATTPSLADQFSADLEILSKRLNVAFVAEGEPFPQKESPAPPTLNESLAPDDAVKEVADYFDYAAVRQGKVYLLTKRYTHPDDMPDVTVQECHDGLEMLMTAIRTARAPANQLSTLEGAIVNMMTTRVEAERAWVPWNDLKTNGLRVGDLKFGLSIWGMACKYYLLTQHDLVDGALVELDNRAPANPYFHWKTIGKSHVFGYDTFLVDFIPLSDLHRVTVPPRVTPLIKPGFWIRGDVRFLDPDPKQDPTDPIGLSEQTKRFLDSQGKSSHVVSLTQAVADLNKRAAKYGGYKVDPAYAPKHVIVAGMDKISPAEEMQALAAVYGLSISRRLDGTPILTAPLMFLPDADVQALAAGLSLDFNIDVHVLDRMIFSAIPAPIYRAVRARVAPGHPGPLENVALGAPKDPGPVLALDQFDEIGGKMQNSAARIFRYFAEQQVQAAPAKQLRLFSFSETARNLFAFTRTVPAYAGAAGLVDCPPPPYFTDRDDFFAHVTLWANLQGDLVNGERLSLTLKYSNADTGIGYGPLLFFDAAVPLGSQMRRYGNGTYPPRLSPDPY